MSRIVEEIAGEEHAGLRLDVFLAGVVEDATRSFLKKLITESQVQINGAVTVKPGRTINPGDAIEVVIPPPPPAHPEPEDIPLDVLYEDEHMLMINKPAGLVVHPAPGHASGTLVNAVLHHCPNFHISGADLRRPGIVHRLDRDTSGVMVVAKTQQAFTSLSEQASAHSFDRRYIALVRGEFPEDHAKVDAVVGRSLNDRGRMAVTGIKGKEAVTHIAVLERYGVASLVRLRLETGRTHQIRVHMRFTGHPVLGDPVYGVTDFRNWQIEEPLRQALKKLRGQALHAELLGVEHPITGETISRTAPAPADMQAALEELRKASAGSAP